MAKTLACPSKPEDRAVGVRLAQQHAGIVDQIARGEIVRAVGDDVVVLENFERVGAREHGVVLDDVQRRIERDELLRGGVELFAADVFGRVDDLALQIAGVHDVEIDQTQGADAGRGQIESQRRAQTAGAHAEHARGFQLALAFHAHFGQDQVARVAREVIGGEFRQREADSVAVAIVSQYLDRRLDLEGVLEFECKPRLRLPRQRIASRLPLQVSKKRNRSEVLGAVSRSPMLLVSARCELKFISQRVQFFLKRTPCPLLLRRRGETNSSPLRGPP